MIESQERELFLLHIKVNKLELASSINGAEISIAALQDDINALPREL